MTKRVSPGKARPARRQSYQKMKPTSGRAEIFLTQAYARAESGRLFARAGARKAQRTGALEDGRRATEAEDPRAAPKKAGPPQTQRHQKMRSLKNRAQRFLTPACAGACSPGTSLTREKLAVRRECGDVLVPGAAG